MTTSYICLSMKPCIFVQRLRPIDSALLLHADSNEIKQAKKFHSPNQQKNKTWKLFYSLKKKFGNDLFLEQAIRAISTTSYNSHQSSEIDKVFCKHGMTCCFKYVPLLQSTENRPEKHRGARTGKYEFCRTFERRQITLEVDPTEKNFFLT